MNDINPGILVNSEDPMHNAAFGIPYVCKSNSIFGEFLKQMQRGVIDSSRQPSRVSQTLRRIDRMSECSKI